MTEAEQALIFPFWAAYGSEGLSVALYLTLEKRWHQICLKNPIFVSG
ncbi:hypothetical protein P4S72_01210 [Vibrio sp. PP-XX7]